MLRRKSEKSQKLFGCRTPGLRQLLLRVKAVPVSMLVVISIGFPFNASSLLSCSCCRYKAGFGLEPEPYRSGLHRNQHRAADRTEQGNAVQDPAKPLPILRRYAPAGIGSATGQLLIHPLARRAPQVAPVARLDNAGMDRIAIPLWKSKQPISRLNKRTDENSNLYNRLWAWESCEKPMNVRKIQPSSTSSWSPMETRDSLAEC